MMETLTEILSTYGLIGMFIGAFLAGSLVPFSSETVLVVMLSAGLDPVATIASATAGNSLGSISSYGIGRLGKTEWVSRLLHVGEEKLAKAEAIVQGRGAWMGVLCFLPGIGTPIAIVLGLMRANPWIASLSITFGKLIRYVALAAAYFALGHI